MWKDRFGSTTAVFFGLVVALVCVLAASINAQTLGSPSVVTSTYFGGSSYDNAWTCATDANGDVYIAGPTQSSDFPTTASALQPNFGGGGEDGFVAKFDKNGQLLWSTYLGGSDWDNLSGVTVDAAGNVVVTGVTSSSDFPVTTTIQSQAPTGDIAFVSVISADGTKLLYSTLLGGTKSDGVSNPTPIRLPPGFLPPADVEALGVAVAVGPNGDLFIAGETNTAIIRGKNDTAGIGLVEVYDRESTGDSKLANISSRGFIDTGDNVMIGGFIVGNNQPMTQTLQPGNYTAIVRGVKNMTGVGLVEVYNVQ